MRQLDTRRLDRNEVMSLYPILMLCGAVMLIATFYALCESVETPRNRARWRETASERREGPSRGATHPDRAQDDRMTSAYRS